MGVWGREENEGLDEGESRGLAWFDVRQHGRQVMGCEW